MVQIFSVELEAVGTGREQDRRGVINESLSQS